MLWRRSGGWIWPLSPIGIWVVMFGMPMWNWTCLEGDGFSCVRGVSVQGRLSTRPSGPFGNRSSWDGDEDTASNHDHHRRRRRHRLEMYSTYFHLLRDSLPQSPDIPVSHNRPSLSDVEPARVTLEYCVGTGIYIISPSHKSTRS